MNDASIIKLFWKRDEQALAEIKLKYESLCYLVAGRILSQREDVEECLNSAYLEIWNLIPPEKPDSLKNYLCRIVKNIAIDKYKYNSAEKRNTQFTVSLDELAECIPNGHSDFEDMSSEELGKAISEFLRTQDDKHRKVFVMRYWYGEAISDIAKTYDLNEKTVATYLFRTRKKLKEFLQEEGYYIG